VDSVPVRAHAAWLTSAGRALLDLFFPPACPGCGRLGVLLCDNCRARIQVIDAIEPRQPPARLTAVASAALFAPPLREAIHRFKYDNTRDLAAPLAEVMVDAWLRLGLAADVLMPVPLHARRLAERGYNQSALLARQLGQALGIPVDERTLVRRKHTRQQVGLGPEERRANVADAFTCQGDVRGRQVILIDDVCTTGATLEACAAALAAAGAGPVQGYTLSRARWLPGQPAPDSEHT